MAGLPAWPKGVGSIPRSAPKFDAFTWADWVELLCLASVDGEITPDDVVDDARLEADDLAHVNVIADHLDDRDDAESADGTSLAADADDAWAREVGEWFRHFEYRAAAFGDAYPFEFRPVDADGNGPTLLRKSWETTPIPVQLYLMLLFSANLRYCRSETSLFTRGFERVSYWAMKRQLGPSAEVYLFGAGAESGAPHPPRYTGSVYQKLKDLGMDIKSKFLAEPSQYPASSSGDAGLDIVGWFPYADDAPSMLIVFAQCAATEEWNVKQFTVHRSKWSHLFRFFAQPTAFVYVPICFRRPTGEFGSEQELADVVFVDRVRLVSMLENDPEFTKALRGDPALALAEQLSTLRRAPFD